MERNRNRLRPEKLQIPPKSMEYLLEYIMKKYAIAAGNKIDEVTVERLPDGRVKTTFTVAQVKKILDEGGTI
jgi:hypothetical protein